MTSQKIGVLDIIVKGIISIILLSILEFRNPHGDTIIDLLY